MFYLLLSFSDPSHNIYSNRWKMLETLRGFLFSANTSALQSWSRVWLGHQLDRLRLASSESIGYCATKLGDVLVSRSENKCQLQRENPSIILKPLCVNHCAQTPCNNRSKAWQKKPLHHNGPLFLTGGDLARHFLPGVSYTLQQLMGWAYKDYVLTDMSQTRQKKT